MTKVCVVQVVRNNRNWIEPVFSAIFRQTFRDFSVVAIISGSEDGSRELLAQKFPEVEIIDPGYNIGFAKGHNLVFERRPFAPFYQLINPDLIIQPDYVSEMLEAFKDEKAGAATGKLYKILNPAENLKLRDCKIIDTTGVMIYKSGRAKDRGQHEADFGQYDVLTQVQAVSGAGAMYRREALESVRHQRPDKRQEYFDEDFHSYWEDVDLTWRMANKGWKNVFAPLAVGCHGRAAGSSEKGYRHVFGFIRHHRALPVRIRRLNYKNHILMYIKNSRFFYPQFFLREFFMFCYALIFEIDSLKVLPEIIRLLPKIWKKRKLIYP